MDVIVASGGLTRGDEVGDLGGVFCGDRPRRRSSDDMLMISVVQRR